MHAITLLGCFVPLVDERVIGVDVPAVERFGGPDSRLGAQVAAHDESWAAAGMGCAIVDGVAVEGLVYAGWWDDALVTADAAGQWWIDGVSQPPVVGARRWAAGAAGVAVWDGATVWFPDGSAVERDAVQALAVGVGAVHLLDCSDGCSASSWVGGVPVATWAAGAGGAIDEWDGEAWAGDPEPDDGAGRVCTADGRCVIGEPGDHLGLAVGGGYAGGTFNKWIVPGRARFVPLGDGPVYALEVGAENQPHALAGDEGTLVFGAPYYPHGGGPTGMVAVVAR